MEKIRKSIGFEVGRFIALNLAAVSLWLSCGVKGDPVPPREPPKLGRGQPTYDEATKELAYPQVPQVKKKKRKESY